MIKVDIVTPSRKLVEGAMASSVKLPAHKGEIGVLPGHTELLTMLSTGILSLSVDGRERKFALSHGFAEVREDRVWVLAETVEESKEIDRERAKKAQKNAESLLHSTLTPEQFKKHQLKLQRALIRQQAAQG